MLRDQLKQFLWYAFLLTIPFGTRILLGSSTPGFHEYESFFLYANDVSWLIILIIGTVIFLQSEKQFKVPTGIRAATFITLIFAGSSILAAPASGLALYTFIRFMLLAALAFMVPLFIKNEANVRGMMLVLGIFALLQGIIGLAQFSSQGALGLGFFGESPLNLTLPGTSTIWAGGGKFLRAYGTFPHPNVLGAFLSVGLIAFSYLYIYLDTKLYFFSKEKSLKWNFKRFARSKYFYGRLLVASSLFVFVTSLAFTFSRGAWISAFIGILFLVLLGWKKYFKPLMRLSSVLLVSLIVVYLFFAPFLVNRVQFSRSEPSINYRITYNQIGLEILKDRPLVGLGIGNQVLSSVRGERYQAHDLNKAWQWEPIHNLYLLVGSEIGVVGFVSFILFFVALLLRLFKKPRSLEKNLAASLLISLLTFGLVDHFLWTLQPGKLLFWVIIGLGISQVLDKREV